MNQYAFKPSSIKQLNEHTCPSHSSCKEKNMHYKKTLWFLVMDKYHFHVFVVVFITKEIGPIRIDWNFDSTLTFEPYKMNEGDDYSYLIGTTETFCKLCIQEHIIKDLRAYELFDFNCRTATFLVFITSGFDAHSLLKKFEEHDVLCGLKKENCLTLSEMKHFINWLDAKQEERHGIGDGCIIS